MYTAFFGLQRDPFSISPDPRFLFLSEHHREALAHLLYGARGGGGFVLLTGDVGTGKTTVCRRFLESTPGTCQVAYIFNPRLSVGELLHSIADEFGYAVPAPPGREPTIKERVDPLNRFLLQAHAAGRNPILIIDEAQNLSPDVLEQLRLLTNLETDEHKLLQIVLIGQPELQQILARPGLEQLAQRIVARFHLGPLDEADTHRYIHHRLGVAGLAGASPFTARALRRIHQRCGGVPRRINLLCDRALLGAYGQGRHRIDADMVERAADEVFGTPSRTASRGRSTALLGLGALAGAALAAAAIGLWRTPAAPPMAAAGPPPVVPAPAQTPSSVLPLAAQLLPSEEAGWRSLAPRWGLQARDTAPCTAAMAQGLQCYRTPRMTLHGARQMDRPALLRLHLPDGAGYAMLDGMDDTRVVLSAGQHRWTLSTAVFAGLWRGDYVSLWRTPPGQQGRLHNGMTGPAAAWVDNRLTELQQRGTLDTSARSLAQKVAAFQRSVGLEVDGQASPATLILLNRASGVNEPRLPAELP